MEAARQAQAQVEARAAAQEEDEDDDDEVEERLAAERAVRLKMLLDFAFSFARKIRFRTNKVSFFLNRRRSLLRWRN